MTSQIFRRRLVALAILVLALVIVAILIAMKPQAHRREYQVPPTMVNFQEVSAERQMVTVTGWGTVQPKRSVNLVPQVSGRIVRVSENLQAGAYFTAGEVLVEIDEADYLLSVQQASAQVAQSEYNLATAREEARIASAEWERTQADAGQGSALQGAKPNALVFHEPQLRQAEAALESAKAGLAQAQLSLSRCRLEAPFCGRVIEETADPGDYVMAGNVLGRIDDTDVAEITVGLPLAEMAWVPEPGVGTAVVRGEFAGEERTWTGRVARLGGAIDEQARTVPVVVEVDHPYENAEAPLMSGLFVSVDFQTPAPAGTIAIPRPALRPDSKVWVLDRDTKLRVRDVHVRHTGTDVVILDSGLVPGERLVTSNLQYVVDGMQLRVEGRQPARKPGGETGVGNSATGREHR